MRNWSESRRYGHDKHDCAHLSGVDDSAAAQKEGNRMVHVIGD